MYDHNYDNHNPRRCLHDGGQLGSLAPAVRLAPDEPSPAIAEAVHLATRPHLSRLGALCLGALAAVGGALKAEAATLVTSPHIPNISRAYVQGNLVCGSAAKCESYVNAYYPARIRANIEAYGSRALAGLTYKELGDLYARYGKAAGETTSLSNVISAYAGGQLPRMNYAVHIRVTPVPPQAPGFNQMLLQIFDEYLSTGSPTNVAMWETMTYVGKELSLTDVLASGYGIGSFAYEAGTYIYNNLLVPYDPALAESFGANTAFVINLMDSLAQSTEGIVSSANFGLYDTLLGNQLGVPWDLVGTPALGWGQWGTGDAVIPADMCVAVHTTQCQ